MSKKVIRRALFGAILACAATLPAAASSGGITGWSGQSGNDCSVCHNGGTIPTVTISGPTLVSPGSTNTYTLTISGGQEISGGLNVSTNAGALLVNPGDGGTWAPGNGAEITHTVPRGVDGNLEVVWAFDWQAPAAPGMATLFGAGNSINRDGDTSGDGAAATTLQITVGAAGGTPGETSGQGLQPFKIDDYDSSTGQMVISYETGCDTDDNNVYYGDLSQVALITWGNEICSIGTSGSAMIQPMGTDLYFVVVGSSAGKEGSYGKSKLGGIESERPPFASSTCGPVQDLSNTCIP